MKKIALMMGVLTALVASEAHAETDVDNFNPQTTFRPNEFPWTSGPISFGGIAEVNLSAAAFHEVDVEMLGDAEYDFDAQTLTFIGAEDGGLMENALGVEVTVEVSVLGSPPFEVGIYNIEETVNGTFSPYLLPGDPERPFGVTESVGPNDLVDTSFTLAGFLIGLDIDWRLDVPGIEYQSTHVVLTDGEDSVVSNELAVYDAEDLALDLILPDAVPGESTEIFATLHGEFDAEVAFVFIVNASVEEASFGPFEVPLDYPVNEAVPVEFPVEQVSFDVPLEPEPGTSTGEIDDGTSTGEPDSADASSGGDSDSDSDGTTTGDPIDPTTGGGDESSGGIPAAPAPSDSGCGCTTGSDAGGFAWMLGLFGLTMLRRRRG